MDLRKRSLPDAHWADRRGRDLLRAAQLLRRAFLVISGSFEMPRISEIEIHGTMGSLYLNRPFTGIEDREREVIFTPVDGKPEAARSEDGFVSGGSRRHARRDYAGQTAVDQP